MVSFKLKGCGMLLAAAFVLQGSAVAQTAVKANGARLALPSPVTGIAMPHAPDPNGTVQVVVRLTDPPLALAVGANAKRLGSSMTIEQRRAYMAMLKQKQDAISAQVRALGGTETSRVGKAQNAVIFSTKYSTLSKIAGLGGVTSVRPVGTYKVSLSETVPYIGAAALQTAGLTGAGIKVAVLDSGIDYTHRNLGGSGSAADYATATANPAVIPAGLYPTAKVIGGIDFVGTAWPNGPRTTDPNPIAEGPDGGHGTHVADIIAGASLDGLHKGVAPGAKLYAVKVCSNQSSSCNGEALLLGMDWILDPNGDLDFSDAPDVVNLSLGGGYGQREDDLTEAVSNAVRFGIVAVISAGNSSNLPYVVGSPSTAMEAISVAQTQVPSATTFALKVNTPASIAGSYGNTATLDFAPLGSGFSGTVAAVGRGCPAGSVSATAPDDVYTSSPVGKVVLIDRGACSISLKVDRAAKAGAKAVLIGLIAAGDAVSFSNGGGDTFVPTLVIQQSLSAKIKANIAAPVTVTVDNTTKVDLIGSMASSSSRGPSYSYSAIKPEIGAPGASVSAEYGTGTGQTAFGGTSGAAPMVAGSAALLLQKFPLATPPEIKSRLMNGAFQTIYNNPATEPGVLAPITRIGSGEVRVDKSAALNTGIWDATNPYSVGLSFGTLRATGITTLTKKVAIRNYSNAPRFYAVTPSFRYADKANGAVTLTASPPALTVPANGLSSFVLTLKVDASKLPAWNLAFPGDQGNGSLLQAVEFDGYVSVADAAGTASVPWHVLPHKAAGVTLASTSIPLGGATSGSLTIGNATGAVDGLTDIYALTGTSPQITTTLPAPGQQDVRIDLKAVGVRQVDVGVPAIQFAVSTWGPRAHPAYPAEFDIYVDSNADGVDDYVIYNSEQGGGTSAGVTGITLVNVVNLSTGASVAKFYADADLNSSNIVLTALASDIGITSPTQKFKFSVYVYDNYFTGNLKDSLTGMTFTYGLPKYTPETDSFYVPAGLASGTVGVSKVTGGAAASPSQSGFLLIYGDGKTGQESDVVTITP